MTGLILALAAAGGVLAFGGVQPLAFAPIEAVVALLAACRFWQKGWPAVSRTTAITLAAILAIPLLQMIDLPRAVLSAISPSRITLTRTLASSVMPLGGGLALSVNAYETQVYFLKLVCYVLVFLLAFQLYQERRGKIALVAFLLTLGVLEAAYGTFQYLSGWQYIFTYAKRTYIYEATGTYINRNHFAGLLEMTLPFLMARMLVHPHQAMDRGRSRWKEIVSSPVFYHRLRDMVLFAVIALGIVFSRSRMGIAGATVGIIVVSSLVFRRTRRRSALAAAFLILALPVVYAVWIGLTPVVERFEMLEQPQAMEQDRLPVWRETTRLIKDYPLLGTGLGTYRWANLRYQDHFFWGYYEHAHSDYLEFAADLGIPAALLILGALWALTVGVARKTLTLQRQSDQIVALGCAGAMAALMLHEITDFNLQIPANAFIFCWIAGTAAAIVRDRSRV